MISVKEKLSRITAKLLQHGKTFVSMFIVDFKK